MRLAELLSMSITASLAILAVLLLRLALARAPRLCCCLLWLAVLFRLLCPVPLSLPLSLFTPLRVPVSEVGGIVYVQPGAVPIPGVRDETALPLGEERQAPAELPDASDVLLTAVWLIGAGAMLLWGLRSLLELRRRLVGAMPRGGNVWVADDIPSPFVLGPLRPKIYLPASIRPGDLDYVLLHERTHLRRGTIL